MTPDPSLQGAVERLTLYADWLADPDDDGNPYTGMEPEGEGKEVDLRTILAALPEPPGKSGERENGRPHPLAKRIDTRLRWLTGGSADGEVGEDEVALLREASRTLSGEALGAVAAERQRQIDVEGWSLEHDDEHTFGELAKAAACYATGNNRLSVNGPKGPSFIWPWEPKWWRPKDKRRNLVRAAALIVAEIERLDRLAAAPKPPEKARG